MPWGGEVEFPNLKRLGMLFVSLRGVNKQGFWFHLGRVHTLFQGVGGLI